MPPSLVGIRTENLTESELNGSLPVSFFFFSEFFITVLINLYFVCQENFKAL